MKAVIDFRGDDHLFVLAATGLGVSMTVLFNNVTKAFGSGMTNALLFLSVVKKMMKKRDECESNSNTIGLSGM